MENALKRILKRGPTERHAALRQRFRAEARNDGRLHGVEAAPMRADCSNSAKPQTACRSCVSRETFARPLS